MSHPRDNRHHAKDRPHQEHRNKPVEKAADFLPHPEVLEAYNYVIEGSAERIISMIEKEQAHRHALENRQVSVMQAGLLFGQLLAAGVAIAVLVLTGMLVMNDQGPMGAFFGVVGLACMTVAFVKGRQVVQNQGRGPRRDRHPRDRISPNEHRGQQHRGPHEKSPLDRL